MDLLLSNQGDRGRGAPRGRDDRRRADISLSRFFSSARLARVFAPPDPNQDEVVKAFAARNTMGGQGVRCSRLPPPLHAFSAC